jgi:hypothetical protein
METNTLARAAFVESPASSPNCADVWESDEAQNARSEANILRWMEYLPEDCIARMIEMGWDITT